MLMLAGCGESGGVTSASSNEVGTGGPLPGGSDAIITPDTVGTQDVDKTTPRNLYNISGKLGTPPALPGQ
jgi:hypothetical protein